MKSTLPNPSPLSQNKARPQLTLEGFLKERQQCMKSNYKRVPLYAKWVSHRLSPYLVYLCARWGISPNQVTLFSYMIGLIGSLCFLSGAPRDVMAGALIFEFYYVLDAVDGQLARYTKSFSKTGSFFDVIGNYFMTPILFLCIGLGQYATTNHVFYVVAGAMAGLGSIWLNVLWDVRANVLLSGLLGKGGIHIPAISASVDENRPSSEGMAKKIFVWTHKLCIMPTVMNVITLSSALSLFLGHTRGLGHLLCLYAVLIPVIGIAKIAKMIWTEDVDKEFQRYS